MEQEILNRLSNIERQLRDLDALIRRVDNASVNNFRAIDRGLKSELAEIKKMIDDRKS